MNARKGLSSSCVLLIQYSMLTPDNVNTGGTWCSPQGEGCPPCFVLGVTRVFGDPDKGTFVLL